MDDLKTLLRDKANEMRLDHEMPARIGRRTRRRRSGTVLLTALLVAGTAYGSYSGVRAVMHQQSPAEVIPAEPPGGPAGGTMTAELGTWIYPGDPQVLQENVEAGVDLTWIDPHEVAIRFADEVLGWSREDVETSTQGDDPPLVAVANPSLAAEVGAPNDLRIVLELRKWGWDGGDLFYVRHARADILHLEPPAIESRLKGPPPDPLEPLTLEGTLDFVPEAATLVAELRSSNDFERVDSSATPTFSYELRRINQATAAPFFGSVTLRDRSGTTLAYTAHPVEFRMKGDTSLDPCEGGAPPAPAVDFQEGPEALFPPAVARTRGALIDAAQERDWRTLASLIPHEGFTFSYGNERDAVTFWKETERSGTPVLEVLRTLLCYTGSEDAGVFIWPEAAEKDPSTWTEADLAPLRKIYSEEELEQIKESDTYNGWRVGIEPDGTWIFFVAGD